MLLRCSHALIGRRVLQRRSAHSAAGDLARVVIVTGGAKGVGLGCTEAFVHDGATVVCLDTDEEALAAAKIVFPTIEGHSVDVSDSQACRNIVADIWQRHGRIDVLINNAGIQPPASCVPLHELDEHWWHKLLAVNLSSVFNLSKPVLPHMIAQHAALVAAGSARTGGGVILNVASVQGLLSQEGVPAYAACKGGVLSLTRQMAMDYGKFGIRVLAINPGTIKTPLVAGLLAASGGSFEEAGRVYPLEQRCGEPIEVGHVAVFLASAKASFMSGCYVNVDGGITAKGGWAT